MAAPSEVKPTDSEKGLSTDNSQQTENQQTEKSVSAEAAEQVCIVSPIIPKKNIIFVHLELIQLTHSLSLQPSPSTIMKTPRNGPWSKNGRPYSPCLPLSS